METRRWPVTTILNIICPGLGHIYVGAAARGIAAWLVAGIVFIIFGITGILSNVWGYTTSLFVVYTMYMFLIVDGIRLSKRFRRKTYNRKSIYWAYVAIFLTVATTAGYIRDNYMGYAQFRHPSKLMVPTILPYDRILIDTFAYRSTPPKENDVVVYESMQGSLHIGRVKRINNKGTMELAPDSLRHLNIIVNANALRGRVTYILFSTEQFGRSGSKIE